MVSTVQLVAVRQMVVAAASPTAATRLAAETVAAAQGAQPDAASPDYIQEYLGWVLKAPTVMTYPTVARRQAGRHMEAAWEIAEVCAAAAAAAVAAARIDARADVEPVAADAARETGPRVASVRRKDALRQAMEEHCATVG